MMRVMGFEAAPLGVRGCGLAFVLATITLFGASSAANGSAAAGMASADQASESAGRTLECENSVSNFVYIPVDSWVYPAMVRLYSLAFLDHIYLGMRPWTWASVNHMLEDTGRNLENAKESRAADEGRELYAAINREVSRRMTSPCSSRSGSTRLESIYTIGRVIGLPPLHDSFHLGSTIINDYCRPYEKEFNEYLGASGYGSTGRFAVYLRGEFEDAPSAAGYSSGLIQTLAAVDGTINPVTGLAYPNQATIPAGPVSSTAQGKLLEAYVSMQLLNHLVSFGKQEEWLGPAQGASMAYSNNAENIYAFHINRIEPLYIPELSRLTGPFRYEFLLGPLGGHTLMPNPLYANNPAAQPNVINPGNPWVHVEKISFRPTDNLELGFERTSLFGGEGHAPVTLHTFMKSFLSLSPPQGDIKFSRDDLGARFGSFDVSYRLPFVRNWLTFYSDSEVHDDVSPIDAPRRAAIRPGLYLSHVPGLSKVDARAEAAMTDPSISNSPGGRFMYWEGIEKQGYANHGQLFGDWIGREDKGGQAWVTYHLSGNEWIAVSARNQKAAKDFIPGGTTLNDMSVQAVKRIGEDFEINGNLGVEHWKASAYLQGRQNVTSATIQFTWFPRRRVCF
jgi:Capsule assembly protein Wzi